MAKFETVPIGELKHRLPAKLLPLVEEYRAKLEKLTADQGGRLTLEKGDDPKELRRALKAAAGVLERRIRFPFRGEEGSLSFYLEKARGRRRAIYGSQNDQDLSCWSVPVAGKGVGGARAAPREGLDSVSDDAVALFSPPRPSGPSGRPQMLLTTAFSLAGALRRAGGRTLRLPLLSALLGAILAGAVLVSVPGMVLPHDRGDEGRLNRHVLSPQITWTPASIVEERGLGQTKSETISFSASGDLGNVEIYVSPELRRFVRVHPTRFRRVDQGQNISVSITIAASATASLGKASGSVQLVRNDLRPEVLFGPLPVAVLVTAVPFSPDPGVPEAILAGSR